MSVSVGGFSRNAADEGQAGLTLDLYEISPCRWKRTSQALVKTVRILTVLVCAMALTLACEGLVIGPPLGWMGAVRSEEPWHIIMFSDCK